MKFARLFSFGLLALAAVATATASAVAPATSTSVGCCPLTAEPATGPAPHVGHMKTYGSTTLYVAGPAKAKAGLLAFTDIFGPDSGRTKADADALGKLGYAVVVVDLAEGDYLDPATFRETMGKWFVKHSYDVISPHIDEAVKYLKVEAGVETFASYGYCWGAWVGARLAASTVPTVTGHVSFHPTWAVENMLNGDNAVDKLAASVKVPQLLLSASDDPVFVREGGSIDTILKGRADIGAQSAVVDFPDQNHGWVIRGDLGNDATKVAVKKAWDLATTFLQTVNPSKPAAGSDAK